MSGLDIATWTTIIGTWVLVIGTLAFGYWQLRQAQRLHSATTLLELRERFYSTRLRQARRELSIWLLRKERGEEPENWEVGMFFELLGHLTHTGVLEKRMVWNAFGTWISGYYFFITRPENLIAQWRKDGGDPLIFAEFEWLAGQMSKIEGSANPGGTSADWTEKDARYILENESHLYVSDAAEASAPPLGQ